MCFESIRDGDYLCLSGVGFKWVVKFWGRVGWGWYGGGREGFVCVVCVCV